MPRSRLPRWLVGLVGGLLLVAVLGGLMGSWLVHSDPASPTEAFTVDGAPCAVTFDAQGMAHLQVGSQQAAYAGLGYLSAQQRLFQLVELRASGAGQLAAMFGSSVLSQDEFFATLDLHDLAHAHYQAMPPDARADLAAYADGVNAWLAAHQGNLPPEFADLGITSVARWQPWDSLTIAMFAATSLDGQVIQSKLVYGALAQAGGTSLANALIPESDGPAMFDAAGQLNSPLAGVPPVGSSATGSVGSRSSPLSTSLGSVSAPLAGGRALAGLPATRLGESLRASNNFVVSGRLTSSGQPIIGNDPHLQLSVPGLLWPAEVRVSGIPNGFDLAALFLAGTPFPISGHTTNIAFGVTFTQTDSVDLRVETLRGTAPNQQVLEHGSWVRVTYRTVTIAIAGASSVTLTVPLTPDGPLLNPALPSIGTTPIAVEQTIAAAQWTIAGMLQLPLATNVASFRAAVAQVGVGLNWVYGDKNGHIAYQMSGLVPLRNAANGFAPVPGGDAAYDWTGFASPAQLPFVEDPASGFLVTANQKIIPDDYAPGGQAVYISRWWDVSDRAARITALIQAATRGGRKFSVADAEQIQLDTTPAGALSVAHLLLADAAAAGLPSDDPNAAASVAALSAWDGVASANSAGALVYEMWLAYLERDAFTAVLGSSSYGGYAQSIFGTTPLQVVTDALKENASVLWSSASLRNTAVATALAEADTAASAQLRAPMANETWGTVHQTVYNHPLASTDPRFAIPSAPAGGDLVTVNTGGWFQAEQSTLLANGKLTAAFTRDALAVGRAIWTVGDWGESRYVLPEGVSGEPSSGHYADQVTAWTNGGYFPFAFGV